MNNDGPRSDSNELSIDRQRYSQCLQYVRAHAAGPVEGLYRQDSVARRVWREVSTLVTIPPAVVLQVLLPQVAEGVSQFSDYQHDMLARARRTTFAMYTLIFGDCETALHVCGRIVSMHERVRGTISPESSQRLAGQSYRANEPAALQWVHATMVHTAMAVYSAIHGALGRDEREQFFQESKIGAAAMGIWPDDMPTDIEAFDLYFDQMVEENLELGKNAQKIIRSLLAPAHLRGVALLCAGFLPERWRGAVGIEWNQYTEHQYEMALRLLRTTRFLPRAARYAPAYHQTAVRMAKLRGNGLTRSERIVRALDERGWIPAGLGSPDRVMRRA